MEKPVKEKAGLGTIQKAPRGTTKGPRDPCTKKKNIQLSMSVLSTEAAVCLTTPTHDRAFVQWVQ